MTCQTRPSGASARLCSDHQVEQFRDRVQDPNVGGGQRHYMNWLAESNDVAAAGWQAGAWNQDLQTPNGWHDVSLGRRYRAPRPAVARANIDCPYKCTQGVAGLECGGDHDEGSCNKRGVTATLPTTLWPRVIGRTTLSCATWTSPADPDHPSDP